MPGKFSQITIAHTPDADDAFMFYALTTGIVKPVGYSIKHELTSMQNLNDAALTGKYEMSAISFAAYPHISDRYDLMDCGACMGYKFGPILVAKKPITESQIMQKTIAIPGLLTTAYWLLKIFCPAVNTKVIPSNEIIDAIKDGAVDAGLIIDGSQMTFSQHGLQKIVDLGEWWYETTKLPLPLGGNIVRKDLPEKIIDNLTTIFRKSIQYALDNRPQTVKYAMRFAQDMSEEQALKFIGRYVNKFTLAYGEEGQQALVELFTRASYAGIFANFKTSSAPKNKFTG